MEVFLLLNLLKEYFFNLKKKNDVFILSKGHAGVLLYTLLNITGKISKREYDLYCKKSGKLGVHPDRGTFGITASTGSLDMAGLAAGMALANRNSNKKFFVLLSDGELHEGSVWETVLFISSKKLKNIVILIDNNDLQSSTRASDTHPSLYPIESKFRSFDGK